MTEVVYHPKWKLFQFWLGSEQQKPVVNIGNINSENNAWSDDDWIDDWWQCECVKDLIVLKQPNDEAEAAFNNDSW